MRRLLLAGAVIVLVVVVVLVIGWSLPVKHRATREATYPVPATRLYALLTTVEDFPSWRSKLTSVVRETPTRFREVGDDGTITYEITEQVPDRRLVTRIADPSLPFGGRWTYELIARGDSTTLRITEDGEVYNPVFRFVSRFLMGHTATLDRYLRDLGRHLHTDVSIT